VNLSARIADYARAGEVLVNEAVAHASGEDGVAFDDIGPVELKGVQGTTHLLRALADG
jgi:class 3 adenylate cyclase